MSHFIVVCVNVNHQFLSGCMIHLKGNIHKSVTLIIYNSFRDYPTSVNNIVPSVIHITFLVTQ